MTHYADLEIKQNDGSIVVIELEAPTREELDVLVSEYDYQSAYFCKA